jgi:HEAT repeats
MFPPPETELQAWLRVLADTDALQGRERLEAAAGLAKWLQGEEAVLEERVAIVQSLPDRMAMFELGKVLVPVIDSKAPLPLRLAAVESYAVTGNVNVLVRLPSSPQPEVRRRVVQILDDIARDRVRNERYWNWHMGQLQSTDPEVFRATLSNLARNFGRDPEVFDILSKQLDQGDPPTRSVAASGLALIGYVDTLIAKCELQAEPDPDVRTVMATYIAWAFTGRPEEAEVLQDLAQDPDEKVRTAARRGLRTLRLRPRNA